MSSPQLPLPPPIGLALPSWPTWSSLKGQRQSVPAVKRKVVRFKLTVIP